MDEHAPRGNGMTETDEHETSEHNSYGWLERQARIEALGVVAMLFRDSLGIESKASDIQHIEDNILMMADKFTEYITEGNK